MNKVWYSNEIYNNCVPGWLSVCPPELREEDSSDKADEHIEKCLGKISDESARVSVSILYCTMLMLIDISQVLRLMCLLSQFNGGLKLKLMDTYQQEIMQVCGCDQLNAHSCRKIKIHMSLI